MADKISRVLFPGFSGGLGHKVHDAGRAGYAIATNSICRFGGLMNGLAEVADATGIAAGYQVVKQIKHNYGAADFNYRCTYNGTDSRLYYQATVNAAWTLRDTSAGNNRCRDVISFHDGTNSIIAWCFGSGEVFRYSVDNGANWVTSTFGGTVDTPSLFLSQQNNLSGPRVLLAVDPNELYFAASLVNGSTVSTSSEIGDASAQNYWTCLIQDDLGVVYCGQRHFLWAYANGPVVLVAGPYNDPPAADTLPTGNLGHRLNFENPQVMRNGVILFQVEGYDIIGVRHGELHTQLAPRWTPRLNGWVLPRLELPINAMLVVGDYLIVALGSGDTATTRSVVSAPGGSNLLQNTFVTTSELYVAQIVGDALVWHGSELTCTNILRGMAWDENDGYLYLFAAGTTAIDVQATRAFFFLTAPEITLSSSNLQLNTTSPAILETAAISAGDPFDYERPLWIKAVTTGLASTVPSLRIDQRWTGDHDASSAYTTVETFTNGARALAGVAMPPYLSATLGRLQLRLVADATSNPDRFAILRSVELVVGEFAATRMPVGAL